MIFLVRRCRNTSPIKLLYIIITQCIATGSTKPFGNGRVNSNILFKQIAGTFQPSTFIVNGFVKRNPHYQTIVGSEALRTRIFGEYPRKFKTKSYRWDTPDGDFIDVDFTEDNEDAKGIVVILHGLESNSKSPLVTKMTQAFLNKGFGCCLLSFRSCSNEDNKTIGAYHLGFTDDIKLVVNRIKNMYPFKYIYLSGFSLGGNAILKFLGEVGNEAYEQLNVFGSVVTCVPFDPVACQKKIDQGFNRAVYSEVGYLPDYT